ncbi:hypothetical protein ACTXT7_003891 [Hymenolepis weldensis]
MENNQEAYYKLGGGDQAEVEGLEKLKALSTTLEEKMSLDVSNTSINTVSPNSSKNSGQSLVAPVTLKLLPASFPHDLSPSPPVPKQQSVPTFCLLDNKTNEICHLKRQKECYCTLASSRVHESPTNRRSKSMLVCRPNRSELVDYKCQELEEITFAKSNFFSITTVSKLGE